MTTATKPEHSYVPKNSPEFRLDMVQYAARYGISMAARKYNTTRKTVRMWVKRYREEGKEGLQNRSHKNTNKHRPASVGLEVSSDLNEPPVRDLSPERIRELMNLRDIESRQRRPAEPSDLSVARGGRISGRFRVSSVADKGNHGIIQFDIISLNASDCCGEYFRKYNLPRYQYTACDARSGAVWMAYAFENSLLQKQEFLQILAGHLKQGGIDTGKIAIDCIMARPTGSGNRSGRSSELFQVVEENFAQCHLYPRDEASFSGIEKFHKHIIEEIYSKINFRNTKSLLKAAEKSVINYNYHCRSYCSSGLPPYQLFCRNSGVPCRENILAMAPVILDTPAQAEGRLKSFLGPIKSVFTVRRRSGEKNVFIPAGKPAVSSAMPGPPKNRIANLPQYEFINLNGVEWKESDSDDRTAVRIRQNQNRRRIIEKARMMLEQRESLARLKENFPLTEGELALLNQKICMDREVRNR